MKPVHQASAWLVGLCVMFLSACASPPRQADDAIAATRQLTPAFTLVGRVSAQDGERSANGRLEWQHAADNDEWLLFNPLGQLAAHLTSDPSGATLRTADGQVIEDRSIQHMLPTLLGLSAPIGELAYWVQAVPAANARVLSVDEYGRPTRISDSGWIIDYQQYAEAGSQATPRRIDAHYGQARIRLIIDDWLVSP